MSTHLKEWQPVAFKHHAFISPSGLHSTINCSMSPWLSAIARGMGADRGDVDTEGYQAEGNRAHELLEDKINETRIDKSDDDYKMLRHINTMLEVFLKSSSEFLSGHNLTIEDLAAEKRFDLSEWVTGCAGTADMSAVKENILFIGDLKFGEGVEVSALDNPQLLTYALGAYKHYKKEHKINGVVMFIGQPRIDNYSTAYVGIDALLDWRDNVLLPAVDRVFNAPIATPSPSNCQFCAGAAICNGLGQKALPPVEIKAAALSPAQLGKFLANKTLFNKFAKEALELGREMLEDGRELPNCKLIKGNKAKRWTERPEVIAEWLDIYTKVDPWEPRKLKSPVAILNELEKGKKELFAENFIDLVPGRPKLVPEDHKQPAINFQPRHFKDLTNANK